MEARGNQIFHRRPNHQNQEDDPTQAYSFGRLKRSRDEHREEVARTGDRLQRTIEPQGCRRRRGVLQKNGGRYFASKDEPIRRRGQAYTRQARKQYNCMSQPAREPHVCCMSNSGTAWYPVHSERIHPGCIHSLAIYPRKGVPWALSYDSRAPVRGGRWPLVRSPPVSFAGYETSRGALHN